MDNSLFLNCIFIEFILKVLFSINDWLNICISIERTISTIQGVRFNKIKSRIYAKFIVIIICIIISLSYIHDPFHRQLIDDQDEKRIWCFVDYSSIWLLYNSILSIIHVIIPFLINILSAFIIIILISRQRFRVQKRQSFKEHLREQFRQHKHLLISPLVLIILVLPRLIISFVAGCMKSARDPWLFLFAYFISFISPVLIFFIFVLPSDVFRKEFLKIIRKKRQLCS